jgi:hypothetical protein
LSISQRPAVEFRRPTVNTAKLQFYRRRMRRDWGPAAFA